jgi:cytochrome c-type biogenesis protein CcsB
MRTALILLLLLALAAIPGSVIPQSGVDSLKASQWQDAHPTLTPVYEKLGLFSVYDSPWFAAIYILLMVSLVGCIVPAHVRLLARLRASRRRAAQPDPAAGPRVVRHDGAPDGVLARRRRAAAQRYRSSARATAASRRAGYLREAGNLLFHLSVLVVLVGFAIGALFGYKGGVILVSGTASPTTSRSTTTSSRQPVRRRRAWSRSASTSTTSTSTWLTTGRAGHGARLRRHLTYRETPTAPERVRPRGQPPADIGGHRGVPDRARLRAGDHDPRRRRRRRLQRADVFLPTDQTVPSFGVVKAPDAEPSQIGLEGEFYPTYAHVDGDPSLASATTLNPRCSMLVYTGDLGWTTARRSRSTRSTRPTTACGKRRQAVPRRPGSPATPSSCPTGWARSASTASSVEQIQISQTPGKGSRCGGRAGAARAAGLAVHPPAAGLGRASSEGGRHTGRGGRLDRSGAATTPRSRRLVAALPAAPTRAGGAVTDAAWETLSNQAVAAPAVVYFLALLAYVVEWASLRQSTSPRVLAGSGGPDVEPASEADVERHRDRVAMFGRLGLLLTALAVVIHFVALLARGMSADPNRVPWGNMYEFTLAGTFVVAALFLVMGRRYASTGSAPVVVTFVLALLMVAVVWLYDPVGPLPEALNSYWLVIHVVSAITATGAFTLGGITSALYLLKERRPRAPDRSAGCRRRVLDRISYRIHAFAFPVWTFAVLITGPIWAHQAWSSYWNWDPKEVWAFITWVVYAAYLHARSTAGWKGRNAAILRAGRHGDAVVQLHRDQLLLDDQPALVRRAVARRRLRRARAPRG